MYERNTLQYYTQFIPLSLSSHKKIGIFIINTNFIYKYEKAAKDNTLLLSVSFY